MAQGADTATLALLDRRGLGGMTVRRSGRSPAGPSSSPPCGSRWWATRRCWPLKAEVGYRHLLRDEKNRAADERSPYTYVNIPPLPPTAAERLYRLVAPRHFQLAVGWLVTWGLLAHVWVWGRQYAEWRQIGVSGWEWLCFGAPAVVLFLLGLLWWWASPAEPPLEGVPAVENDASVGRALFTLRSANLQSGVSVLTPLLFVTLAVYLLAFAQLKRLRLLRERRTEPALQERLAERFGSSLDHTGAEHRGWGEVSTLEGAIEESCLPRPLAQRLAMDQHCALRRPRGAAFGLLRVIPAIDSRAWHYVLVLAQGALLLGVLLSYGQFAVLWRELRKLLQHLTNHSMAGAFERLPRRLIGQFRWNPLPEMPHTGPLLGQYFQLLAHHIDVVNTVGGSAREVAEAGLEATQSTHGRLALAMPRSPRSSAPSAGCGRPSPRPPRPPISRPPPRRPTTRARYGSTAPKSSSPSMWRSTSTMCSCTCGIS